MKNSAIILSLTFLIFSCSKDSSTPEPAITTPISPTTGNGSGSGGNPTPTDSNLFITYSFNAQIKSNQSPNAEVSSYLDDNNNTHIAWIKDDGVSRDLMYTVFSATAKTFNTQTAVSGAQDENLIAPEIITDDANNPHIVFFKKRDNNLGISNGNFAVMYTTSDGFGFTTSQVSTNPTDPSTDDDTGLFNCSVNGRPSVYLNDGVIKVSYQSDANSNTSWNNFLITATKSGGSWTRTQTLDIDAVYGNDNPNVGFSFPQYSTGNLHTGFIDISNYNPHFASESSSWSNTQIPGYSGALGTNKHIQTEQDYNGITHLSWFNTENDKFCHTTINNGSYTSITETSTLNSATGNFYPVAVDRTYGDYIMFYHDFAGNGYIVAYDYEVDDGSFYEEKLETDQIGAIYGRRALFYNNEYFSLTTASDTDDRIYVTIENN